MRRLVGAWLLLVPVVAVAACGTGQDGVAAPGPAASSPAGSGPVPPVDADLYIAVLRRYLGAPEENSFADPPRPVYVLDRVDQRAADPMRGQGPGAGPSFGAEDRRRIGAGLRDVAEVRFVGSPDEVLVDRAGCPQVRDGGILIVLGSPDGGPDRVEVGISGFVACLGATWLTYVVERRDGGWRVTGTTGSAAVA